MENEDNDILNRSVYKYQPELIEKAMIGDTEEANELLKEPREIYLNEIHYRYSINNNLYREKDLYIISKEWYEKWKNYVKYKTVKKTCKTPEIYIKIKPISFTIKPELYPGPINNDNIVIKKDDYVIINDKIPLLNPLKKNKIDYKFFPKESYEIFKKRYGDKNAIKVPFLRNRDFKSREYNKNCKNFVILFLPRKEIIDDNTNFLDYHIYVPELICDNELNTYLIDLLDSPSNSDFKKQLGINELSSYSIKIYHLKPDIKYYDFKKILYDNKDKFKENEKINAKQYLKILGDKFQIIQFNFNYLIVEFTKNQESEYFENNIEKDNDLEV
jgi:hypothetical protein